MKYRLADTKELEAALAYLAKLSGQEAVVNITKVNPKRTLNQNSYYHLLLGIAGMEWGYSLEEIKIIHKREVSQSIFVYEKNGKKFLRSSADLDTKELTNAIEQLKMYAAKNGLVLPDPNDTEKLRFYENEIERNQQYLGG